MMRCSRYIVSSKRHKHRPARFRFENFDGCWTSSDRKLGSIAETLVSTYDKFGDELVGQAVEIITVESRL